MATTLIAAPDLQEELRVAPPTRADAPTPKRSSRRAERIAQLITLVAVVGFPAILCVRAACVADLDIWWHMRVGEWILQHHAVPHLESYSRELTGTPWIAYSWLYELLTVKIFGSFGLAGIVGYSAAMVFLIACALRHMVQRLQADFTLNVVTILLACFSFARLYTPRPWLFSILFFTLQLDILMHARRSGRVRELAWLPVILALWANIHIEFIYGLFVVGIAFADSLIAARRRDLADYVPVVPMGCAFVASTLATLANPYGWRLYTVVYNLATQGGGLNVVSEMQAIPFRTLADYSILLLALASVGALVWNRRFRLFECALLLFAIVMSFRSQRDVWLMSITAAAILAAAIPGRSIKVRLPRFAPALTTIVAACLVLISFRILKVNEAELQAQVSANLPVQAVEAVRQNRYAGPVFNEFNWGGYLIWALRQPVTIDGRTNLYGNARIDRSIATWSAQPNWGSDPMLASAGVVIGPATAPLMQLLRLDSHFRLAYQDKVAAVFVAQKGR